MAPPLDPPRPTDPASGSAADVVVFTGTAGEVKAYCEQNFGPEDGAVVLRTPQDLDAFFELDPRCAPSS